MREILIATGNPAKQREIAAMLGPPFDRPLAGATKCDGAASRVRWLGLSDLSQAIPEPIEDGATFLHNAILKAHHYARASGRWALADDSGLEVDALGGAPGVHSARYAGVDGARAVVDAANNRKLIENLRGVSQLLRTARFRCVLALSDGERILATADGVIEGEIIDTPRGAGGFGYDPHFLVPELGVTTAELPAAEKNRISHRGRALQALKPQIERLIAGG